MIYDKYLSVVVQDKIDKAEELLENAKKPKDVTVAFQALFKKADMYAIKPEIAKDVFSGAKDVLAKYPFLIEQLNFVGNKAKYKDFAIETPYYQTLIEDSVEAYKTNIIDNKKRLKTYYDKYVKHGDTDRLSKSLRELFDVDENNPKEVRQYTKDMLKKGIAGANRTSIAVAYKSTKAIILNKSRMEQELRKETAVNKARIEDNRFIEVNPNFRCYREWDDSLFSHGAKLKPLRLRDVPSNKLTIIHEMGHQLDFFTETYGKVVDGKTWQQAKNDLFKEIGEEEIVRTISPYGATDPYEMIAEAFTLYIVMKEDYRGKATVDKIIKEMNRYSHKDIL